MENKIKQQLEKLNRLDINLDDFYAISIYRDRIILQGDFNKEVFEDLNNKGYKFRFLESNLWFVHILDGLDITLLL